MAGPSPWPKIATISPGETAVASYDAALVTLATTGCGTVMAFCACGTTSRVMESAGKVVLTPLELTLRSAVWRTMALRLFWPYCHTCAVSRSEEHTSELQ